MKRVPGSVVDEMVLMNAVDELTYDRLQNILQIETKDVDRKYGYVVAGAPEMLVLLCVVERVVHLERLDLQDIQRELFGVLQTEESRFTSSK